MLFICGTVGIKAFNVATGSEQWNEPKAKAISSGDIEVEAAQILLFVECKRLNGQLSDYHAADAKASFNLLGLYYDQLKDSKRVNQLINQWIEGGSCSVVENYDRARDMVGTAEENRLAFDEMTRWQQEIANVHAEAECRLRKGEFSAEGREAFLADGLDKLGDSLPTSVTQEEVESLFSSKEYFKAITYAGLQKINNNDCTYIPGQV